jgi:amino-acid N-acetyltransferase
VPVIPPLGFDADGNTYRINSDAIAVRVAQDLGAVKIIFLTTTEGVYYQGDLLRQISAGHTREMLKNRREITPPAVRSIVEYSADACRAGIPRVHVLNGRQNEALLTEVFSSEGIGTMIYSDDYTVTRPANRRDSRRLLGLLHDSGISVEESREAAEAMNRHPENFWLLEIDENPVACLGLRLCPEEHKAEIDALFVSSGHANRGYARQLLSRCEARCAEQGIHRIALVEPKLRDYFRNLEGWQPGALQDLPRYRQKELKEGAREEALDILVKRLNA